MKMPRRLPCPRRLHRLLAVVALMIGAMGAARAADLTVSAAASLGNAFKSLAPAFEAAHPGTQVRLNFAASDALLAQISKGAPVDVFAAADEESMDRAAAQSLLLPGTRQDFIGNRLVLIVPAASGATVRGLADLRSAAVQRVALGKPEGVPAGRYARGALEAARLWPAIQAKAVYAVNVRQALDYVARAEADAGFVYATDAAMQSDKVRVVDVVPTPTPIRYPVAVVAGSAQQALARQFIEFLRTPAAQEALIRHGFIAP